MIRHIFRCCWRESVRPLQYYCRTLPMLHLVNQTKLLFWKKMYTNSNVFLYMLSRYAGVPSYQPIQYTLAVRDCWKCQVCCLEVFYRDSSYLECVYFVLFFCTVLLCVCSMCFMFVFYVATFATFQCNNKKIIIIIISVDVDKNDRKSRETVNYYQQAIFSLQ